jgi:mannonate dehydratase
MNRRNFVQLSSAATMLQGAAHAQPKGNKWSDTGIKLGVSHQRPQLLDDADHVNYLKQMGIEYVEARIPVAEYTFENLVAIKRKVEDSGLKLFEIMLSDKYNSREFTLARPDRDKDIALFQSFLKDLGKAGIDATTYAWNTVGQGASTGSTMTRGCRTRLFEYDKTVKTPPAGERAYSEEEMWDNYEYFIKRVLPVAEDAGVRLQLHPNDPPVDYGGVARIFKSRKAFRRALEIANYSPYSGFLMCIGCWGEMVGPEGKGEDIVGAIHEFGSRGHIFQIHYRNISSPGPSFHETFPDNGYMNMYKIMRALGEVNYNGMVVPDHVPSCGNNALANRAGEAYIFGYIRAMIQAVNTDLGRVS